MTNILLLLKQFVRVACEDDQFGLNGLGYTRLRSNYIR